MVEPVYPTYNRPQFDLAPILAKAGSLTLQQQAIDQNKVMNPLEVARAQQQVSQADKMNPLELQREQQAVEAGGRANEMGAATEEDTIAKIKADAQYGVKSAIAGMDYLSADTTARKAQAIAKVTEYVQAHPDSVDAAARELVNEGLLKPEDVQEWAQHATDPKLAAGYIAAGDAAQQAMAARGLPPGSYGKTTEAITARTAAQAAQAEAQVLARANVETNKFMARNPTATQEQIDAFRSGQVAALKGQKAPSYLPPPPPGPPDWWERNAPEFLGGRPASAEAAGSVVEDKAAREEQLAPPEEKPSAKTREIKPAGAKAAAPAPIDAPATFTGDASDEGAVKAWYNSLPKDSAFIPPGNPNAKPLVKHSNFAE